MSTNEKLGVVVVGLNGAVSTTLIAGTMLMVKGLVPRHGMVTSPSDMGAKGGLTDLLDFAPLESLVFGGWDINNDSLLESAHRHGVFRKEQLAPVAEELEKISAWPAIFDREYAKNLSGKHITAATSHRGQIAAIQQNLADFKAQHSLDRIVLANLSSTEKYLEPSDAYETLEAFEAALDRDDPCISPAMRYFYAVTSMGIPHANFAPSLANVPALYELALQNGVPYAGMDGKTGQTLVKTAMASMFRARRIGVDGWYSTNFLGNNDGLVLDSPDSNKTKVLSKAAVLDSILGYKVANHQVHIHYYKPRGDAKEAWDNIDLLGFAGVPMQMKINFLCQDSALAAPLVIDLVRLLDVAKRCGESGIQEQLSFFFKSPYCKKGEQPEHDLFLQEEKLYSWARSVAQSKKLRRVS